MYLRWRCKMGEPITTAAIIGGGAMLGSTALGMFGAGEAADTQAEAFKNASDSQMQMYLQSRADQAPWREAGVRALGELEKTAYGPGEFVPSEQPGYEFGYKELVENPLLRGASAAGKLRSGDVLKSLSDRAQDYASLQYDNWLNRWLTKIQPMQSLAGLGQSASLMGGNQAIQTGQSIGQNIIAGGQAQASGIINQTNALTGSIMGGARNYLDYQMVNKLSGSGLNNFTLNDPTPTTYNTPYTFEY